MTEIKMTLYNHLDAYPEKKVLHKFWGISKRILLDNSSYMYPIKVLFEDGKERKFTKNGNWQFGEFDSDYDIKILEEPKQNYFMFKKAKKIDHNKMIKFDYCLDSSLKLVEVKCSPAEFDEITLIKEGHNGNLDTMLAQTGQSKVIYFGKWNDGIF